jgi:predicted NAD/FAD-binding protein
MNNLQAIDKAKPVFVTLNPITPPEPELVFDKHIFTHPVFTKNAIAAQERIPQLQGINNSWYCGAYTRYGFHEDGLLSAVNVVKSMGVTVPWE